MEKLKQKLEYSRDIQDIRAAKEQLERDNAKMEEENKNLREHTKTLHDIQQKLRYVLNAFPTINRILEHPTVTAHRLATELFSHAILVYFPL